jgi:hypothetical protein
MLGPRYDSLRALSNAVTYLIMQFPHPPTLGQPTPAEYELRLAIELLQSLHKLVTWCDLATLAV